MRHCTADSPPAANYFRPLVQMLGQHISGYNMASVLEEMNSYGIVPNQRTFKLLLQAHERAKACCTPGAGTTNMTSLNAPGATCSVYGVVA
jgi:hypothetical protein